jgi:hypothetical protein
MSPTDIGILALIVVAFSVFGVTLAYYTHRSN